MVDEHGAPIEDFEVVPARAGIDPSGRGVSLGGGEFTYRCLTRHRGAGRFGHFLFSVHARGRVPYEMYPSEEQLAVLQRGRRFGRAQIDRFGHQEVLGFDCPGEDPLAQVLI